MNKQEKLIVFENIIPFIAVVRKFKQWCELACLRLILARADLDKEKQRKSKDKLVKLKK
jgi:hypothetical protein